MNEYAVKSQERIRQLINERCGGSQQVFADRAGINKASVSQYVNGRNAPTNLTATKISIAFGVAPAWVMGFDVAPFDKVSEVAAKLGRLSPDNLQLVENLIDTLLGYQN